MLASTNKFSKEIAPPQPGILKRKCSSALPRSTIIFFFHFSFFIFLFSCQRSTEPLIIPAALQLEAEGVTCTEVWLRLKGEDEYYGKTLQLYRSDSLFMERKWTRKDTLLLDEDLEPSTNYSYVAKIVDDKNLLGQSAVISITTMDTTSHDFSWQIFEFGGEKGSSVFYDVAIIDENNIWAVGEIYLAEDSLPHIPYNAVHWNGVEWELKRIRTPFRDYTIVPKLEGIFAFNKDDVWITSGTPKHWNGIKWTNFNLWEMGILGDNDGGVTRIWGKSSNDLYFAGRKGTIVHYNGVSWRRIESGTDVNFTDIYNYNLTKWVCGWQNNGESILLTIDNASVKTIWSSSNSYTNYSYRDYISTLWSDNRSGFLLSGNGFIYWHSQINPRYVKKYNIDFGHFIYSLRGISFNDVIIVGDRLNIWHWNGINFFQIKNVQKQGGSLYRVDYKMSTFIAVGITNSNTFSKAVIIVGKRS